MSFRNIVNLYPDWWWQPDRIWKAPSRSCVPALPPIRRGRASTACTRYRAPGRPGAGWRHKNGGILGACTWLPREDLATDSNHATHWRCIRSPHGIRKEGSITAATSRAGHRQRCWVPNEEEASRTPRRALLGEAGGFTRLLFRTRMIVWTLIYQYHLGVLCLM